MEHNKYLIRFSLPDGEHLMEMNAHPSVVEDHARRFVSHNPDGVFISVEPTTPEKTQAAAEAIRTANPNRPLATDLGLDTPNRILTNPEIARNLAAQASHPTLDVPAPPQPSGGFGCC